MVQAEVAERLAASPGTKAYGVPSVKVAGTRRRPAAGSVPRSVFWPVPNVDSGLVRPGQTAIPYRGGAPRCLRGGRPIVRQPAQDAALGARLVGRFIRCRRSRVAQAGVDRRPRGETLDVTRLHPHRRRSIDGLAIFLRRLPRAVVWAGRSARRGIFLRRLPYAVVWARKISWPKRSSRMSTVAAGPVRPRRGRPGGSRPGGCPRTGSPSGSVAGGDVLVERDLDHSWVAGAGSGAAGRGAPWGRSSDRPAVRTVTRAGPAPRGRLQQVIEHPGAAVADVALVGRGDDHQSAASPRPAVWERTVVAPCRSRMMRRSAATRCGCGGTPPRRSGAMLPGWSVAHQGVEVGLALAAHRSSLRSPTRRVVAFERGQRAEKVPDGRALAVAVDGAHGQGAARLVVVQPTTYPPRWAPARRRVRSWSGSCPPAPFGWMTTDGHWAGEAVLGCPERPAGAPVPRASPWV